MATRTLSEMRTRIMRITGQDSNDTELSQIVDDYINRSYQDILRRHSWGWLRKEGVFNTVASVSSGTVSISGSSVTGIGTNFDATMVGYYINVGDLDNSAYRILAVTSSTALTIEGPVSSAVTASTYEIFKSDYALAIGLDEGYLEYIVDTMNSTKIYPLSPNTGEDLFPNWGAISNSNSPDWFTIVGRNSLNQVLIRFIPIVIEARTFRYVAFDSQTDLATASDSPLIPERFQEVIEEGALARIFAWQGRPDLSSMHTNLYESYIKEMRNRDVQQQGVIFEKECNDLPKRRHGRGLRLPPAYGGVPIGRSGF